MADIIRLLPENIANQIAAGEVVQRPASVVKELLENSLDAGSTQIQLVLKDAGRTLIQVIDNGFGMSETDARMSFERHATSKIRSAEDLFALHTMGFRGEALASIAAVAQVEMKTRQHQNELGIRILIEASELKIQEECQCAAGTNLAIKNLFYNIPARRNFLKSNTVELRHIIDEFERIGLANPHIAFSLYHNQEELSVLPKSNLRQRIVNMFGNQINQRLVPISEETDVVKMAGFVGKPESAKKTRGEQFFFVNERFIKSHYLHHAVMAAYESLITKDAYPFYAIFLTIPTHKIDVNVHPTKQEIKFEDERLIYNYLRVAVRHALAQNNITPSLDFEQDQTILDSWIQAPRQKLSIENKISEQAEHKEKISTSLKTNKRDDAELHESNLKNWEKLYEGLSSKMNNPLPTDEMPIQSDFSQLNDKQEVVIGEVSDEPSENFIEKKPYQIHFRYILSQVKSGYILIDQTAATERILYEKYMLMMEQQKNIVQQELFPITLTYSLADSGILKGILEEINELGFDIRELGNQDFVVYGVPADVSIKDVKASIDVLLEQFKMGLQLKLQLRDNLARSLAKSSAIPAGKELSTEEMENIIHALFATAIPFRTPDGKACFITHYLTDIAKEF